MRRSRHHSWLCSLALLAPLVVAQEAVASSITLFFNNPASNEVELLSGKTTLPITIGVFNEESPNDPEDFLTGWQVSLVILPEPGSTGALTFASPTGPTTEDPSNYVLEDIGAAISVTNGGDTLFAFDFNFPATGGVDVPTTPGAALLAVELAASQDALGEFGIYALGGAGGSEWTDATPVLQQVQSFLNVPAGVGPVLLGSVRVSVPEPGSVALLSLIVFSAQFSRRRQYQRAQRS